MVNNYGRYSEEQYLDYTPIIKVAGWLVENGVEFICITDKEKINILIKESGLSILLGRYSYGSGIGLVEILDRKNWYHENIGRYGCCNPSEPEKYVDVETFTPEELIELLKRHHPKKTSIQEDSTPYGC